jgi:hypothetical protein
LTITEALALNLICQNYNLANAAWEIETLKRLTEHLPPLLLLQYYNDAIFIWLEQLQSNEKQSVKILTKILESLANKTIWKKLANQKNIDLNLSNSLHLSEGIKIVYSSEELMISLVIQILLFCQNKLEMQSSHSSLLKICQIKAILFLDSSDTEFVKLPKNVTKNTKYFTNLSKAKTNIDDDLNHIFLQNMIQSLHFLTKSKDYETKLLSKNLFMYHKMLIFGLSVLHHEDYKIDFKSIFCNGFVKFVSGLLSQWFQILHEDQTTESHQLQIYRELYLKTVSFIISLGEYCRFKKLQNYDEFVKSKFTELQKVVLQFFKSCLTLPKLPFEIESIDSNSFRHVMTKILKPIARYDPLLQLLNYLLTSKSKEELKYLAVSFKIFPGSSDFILYLLRLLTQQNDVETGAYDVVFEFDEYVSSSFSIENKDSTLSNFEKTVSIISDTCKSAALQTIASWVENIVKTNDIHSPHCQIMLSLSWILSIYYCNSSNSSLRAASLGFFKKCLLLSDLKFAKFDDEDKISKFPSSQLIKEISSQILTNANSIAMDPTAIKLLLRSNANEAIFSDLTKSLLNVTSICQIYFSNFTVFVCETITMTSLDQSWPFLEKIVAQFQLIHFETSSIALKDNIEKLFSSVCQSFIHLNQASSQIQESISRWIVSVFTNSNITSGTNRVICRSLLQIIIENEFVKSLDNSKIREDIFQAVLYCQTQTSEKLSLALQKIPVDCSKALQILLLEITEFLSNIQKIQITTEDDISSKDITKSPMSIMDVDDDGHSDADEYLNQENILHLNEPLQIFLTKLEKILLIFQQNKNSNYFANHDVLICQTIRAGFQLIHHMNSKAFKILFSFEYLKTMLIELLLALFNEINIPKLSTITTTKPKKSKKSSNDDLSNLVDESNLKFQASVLLKCLKLSRTLQLQSVVLQCLKMMMIQFDHMKKLNFLEFCQFLSIPNLTKSLGKEKLIGEILKVVVEVMAATSGESTVQSPAVLYQDIYGPLFLHISQCSVVNRRNLLDQSLKTLGSSSLPGCIVSLLVHVVVTYDCSDEDVQHDHQKDFGFADSSHGHATMILLSMSAQRKAQRIRKTTLSEEIFQLGKQLISC